MTAAQVRAAMRRNAKAIERERSRLNLMLLRRNELWSEARAAGIYTDEIAAMYGVTHGAVSRVTTRGQADGATTD